MRRNLRLRLIFYFSTITSIVNLERWYNDRTDVIKGITPLFRLFGCCVSTLTQSSLVENKTSTKFY